MGVGVGWRWGVATWCTPNQPHGAVGVGGAGGSYLQWCPPVGGRGGGRGSRRPCRAGAPLSGAQEQGSEAGVWLAGGDTATVVLRPAAAMPDPSNAAPTAPLSPPSPALSLHRVPTSRLAGARRPAASRPSLLPPHLGSPKAAAPSARQLAAASSRRKVRVGGMPGLLPPQSGAGVAKQGCREACETAGLVGMTFWRDNRRNLGAGAGVAPYKLADPRLGKPAGTNI